VRGGDLRRSRGHEAPAELTNGTGHRRRAEHEAAHGAADAIGSDHEVVRPAGSVAELDRDATIALSDAFDGPPQANGHAFGSLPEQGMQLGSPQREARPDGRPQLGDVDLAQQLAPVVGEPLPWDLDDPGGNRRFEPESAQGTSGVAGQVIPAPDGGQARSRSTTSTATPMRASSGASASPAMPPPTIRTRSDRAPIAVKAVEALVECEQSCERVGLVVRDLDVGHGPSREGRLDGVAAGAARQ
jgi:hypothetical protein